MTYQQYYEKLYKEFAEAGEEYMKLNKQLSLTNGFGDSKEFTDHAIAKVKWQNAANAYHGFLDHLKGKDFDVDDEFIAD